MGWRGVCRLWRQGRRGSPKRPVSQTAKSVWIQRLNPGRINTRTPRTMFQTIPHMADIYNRKRCISTLTNSKMSKGNIGPSNANNGRESHGWFYECSLRRTNDSDAPLRPVSISLQNQIVPQGRCIINCWWFDRGFSLEKPDGSSLHTQNARLKAHDAREMLGPLVGNSSKRDPGAAHNELST